MQQNPKLERNVSEKRKKKKKKEKKRRNPQDNWANFWETFFGFGLDSRLNY